MLGGAQHLGASQAARLAVVVGVAALSLSYSAYALWNEDFRYSLPTPRPAGLVEPSRGTTLEVDRWLASVSPSTDSRPVLLHFFNPECSCTRFNLEHLRRLHARFGHRVRFVGVAQTALSLRDLATVLESVDFELPYVVDRDGSIARAAGIYATPQAVLVDGGRRLVYRGNYNVSRYCTDPSTEFVRIALESLVSSHAPDSLPETPAYGCSLPENSQPRGTRGEN